jgi:hypothetical protein
MQLTSKIKQKKIVFTLFSSLAHPTAQILHHIQLQEWRAIGTPMIVKYGDKYIPWTCWT